MSSKVPLNTDAILKGVRVRGQKMANCTKNHADKYGGADPRVYDALFALNAPPKEAYLASAIEQAVKATAVVGQGIVKRLKNDPNERVILFRFTPPALHCRPGRLVLDARVPRKMKSALKK